MSLSEAQKRAIKKYMQKNKDKINEQQLDRYHNRGYRDTQKQYYLTKKKPFNEEFKRLASILTP